MGLLEEAKALQAQIVEDRRYLHQIPEVGMELPESAAYIKKRLDEMGIASHPCGVLREELQEKYAAMGIPGMKTSTGLVATLGHGSPCVLLRADFDALPMREDNDLPFRSTRSASHMCGHDSHAAMLLGAAQILKRHESELNGTVKLMFQPGEELGYGSQTMVEDGLLENPKVDAAFGLHVMSTVPVGKVRYTAGVTSASLDTFSLKIQGKGGHTSTPQLCVDPLMIANQVYTALNLLMTREVDPQAAATLSCGTMHAGTASNILPDTAELQFGLRTYDVTAREHILRRIPEVVDAYIKAWRGSYTLDDFHCPCTFTDEALLARLLPAMEAVVGPENLEGGAPMSGTEDFSYIAQAVPSVFVLLGAGGPDHCPHHNPRMVLEESVFWKGAALHAMCAMRYLQTAKETEKGREPA